MKKTGRDSFRGSTRKFKGEQKDGPESRTATTYKKLDTGLARTGRKIEIASKEDKEIKASPNLKETHTVTTHNYRLNTRTDISNTRLNKHYPSLGRNIAIWGKKNKASSRLMEKGNATIGKSGTSIKRDTSYTELNADYTSRDSPLTKLKQKIVQSTALDKTILDELISKLIITQDEREEIIKAPSQTARNEILLEFLTDKPYNTFGFLACLLEEFDKHNEDVQHIMRDMKRVYPEQFKQRDLDQIELPNIEQHEQDLDELSTKHRKKVQIQKNYRIIIEKVNCRGTLCDILLSNDLLTSEEREEICAEGLTRNESCRRMLGILLRKDCSGFLDALGKDHADIADTINKTTVTNTDLRLIKLGQIERNQRKTKEDPVPPHIRGTGKSIEFHRSKGVPKG